MTLRPLTLPPCHERFRSGARILAVVSGATLLAFHGGVFAAQAADGRLEDPWLVLRWLIAAGLVAALAAIRYVGGSMWTRQGLAVWVVAAMLHGPAAATEFSNSIGSLALPQTPASSVLESLLLVSAFAVAVWMLGGLFRRGDRHANLYRSVGADGAHVGIFDDSFSPKYFSRPPPLLN